MNRPRRGVTLVELMVSSALIVMLLGMAVWILRNAVSHKRSSENKLTLLSTLQRIMFLIEKDFYAARRHTLGNALCHNITYAARAPLTGNYQTTSDPGFDVDYPMLTNDSSIRTAWYSPLIPARPPSLGATSYAEAFIDRTPANRFHGAGSMAISSNQPMGSTHSVRSPDFSNLRDEDYVLAGWIRGDADNTAVPPVAFQPVIALQTNAGNGDPGFDVAGTLTTVITTGNNWRYVTLQIPRTSINTAFTYNVYLRTSMNGNNPTRFMTAFFDDISLTPSTVIARVNFAAAAVYSPADVNVNLHNNNQIGLVFFRTEPRWGTLQEVKYIFGHGDQRTFPPSEPDLLRYYSPVPHINPYLGVVWPGLPFPDSTPPPLTQIVEPLTNISSLDVNWVGDPSSGTIRPVNVRVVVRDRSDATKTLSYSKTVFPPTD